MNLTRLGVEDGVFRGHGGDQLVIYQSKDHKPYKKFLTVQYFLIRLSIIKLKLSFKSKLVGDIVANMAEISRAEAINCKRNLNGMRA